MRTGNRRMPDEINRVGNIMLDSLKMMRPQIEADSTCESLRPEAGNCAVVRLHHPSDADTEKRWIRVCGSWALFSIAVRSCFAVHPRTRKTNERGVRARAGRPGRKPALRDDKRAERHVAALKRRAGI